MAYSRLAWRLRGSTALRRLRALPLARWAERTKAGQSLRHIYARQLEAPPIARAPLAVEVQRYSVFQGTLRLRVQLGLPAHTVRAVTLCLPGGETIPVPLGGAALAEIDATLPCNQDPAAVASATLLIGLHGAPDVRIGDLGAALNDPAHAVATRFQSMLAQAPPGRLLEVGARARSGIVRRDLVPPGWEYSGFDIAAGPNVDVLGDAHQLSRHYPAQHFDAVSAYSVLEHLLMPWKFVIELNRVLKPGALGLFTTHQCWPLHDQPWDFWRFSDQAWAALLNPATGFEIIEARMGEPAFIVANKCHAQTAFAEVPAGALASFVLFRKTGETGLDWNVDLGAITKTSYPK